MSKLAAEIPSELMKKIKEEVALGIHSSVSSAVVANLRNAYAQKSRSYLRWLARTERLNEEEMLKDLEGQRHR